MVLCVTATFLRVRRNLQLARFAPFIGCGLLATGIAAQQPASTRPSTQTSPATSTQPTVGQPVTPVTLDDALRAAQAFNAQLPVAARGVDIARAVVRENRASRYPSLALATGVNAGGPIAYTQSQGAIQVVGSDTLFAGGRLRASIRAARYRVEGAGAGFRAVQKDVDLAVRLRFSELLRAESEITFRQQGIERLNTYLTRVQQLRAAGQPVGGDVLTTQVRLGSEQAFFADAARARDAARLQLNDLMGREPNAPLTVVPLPDPPPPPAPVDLAAAAPWVATPEIREAAANSAATQAGIAVARSERRPEVLVSSSLGALPTFGQNVGTGPNSGAGLGGAVFLSLTLPFFDGGTYRARLDQAQLYAQQARDSETVVRRQVRLSYQLASADLTRLYEQVETWARNVPIARDAYLQTQSIYNGGAATALEVLDAYTSWINANQLYADAVLRYRGAEANYLRWGTP